MIIIVGTKMQAATATAGEGVVVAVAGIQIEAITTREPNPLDP